MLNLAPAHPLPDLRVPGALEGLDRLAYNLHWTWSPLAQEAFAALNPELWAAKAGPVRIVRETDLDKVASDVAEKVRLAVSELDEYLSAGKSDPVDPIVYFCAEYGLHETFNLYAGGLGILAGDHCKEASDLDLPFLAIGLFYRRGFFRQMVDFEGRQEHLYPEFLPHLCPVREAAGPDGKPLAVSVPVPGRILHAKVWRVDVGRTPLLLLDTDIPENAPEDRMITSQLYTSGREMRLYQELLLGVGGARAVYALGLKPTVWHLNEGHSALLLLERLLRGEKTAKDSVITIHTPVPEGNERFDARLTKKLIEPVIAGSSLKAAALLKKGLGADGDPKVFDMTAFALRHSRAANGVSILHGQTADETWREIAGYPVQAVTNGVHMPTWLGPEIAGLFREVEFDDTQERPEATSVFDVPDEALWQAHQAQKQRLIAFARKRLFVQFARHGHGPDELREIAEWLDPDSLLIGFARRFATYKRASLLFSDEKRLAKLLKQNVQIVFSGKAHPSDRGGQALIAEVYERTRDPKYRGKILLLEDYDMEVGRHLVQGVDVWLNNPRRPLEASGTSGMKAAANAIPNVSILDGWWDEAARKDNGFIIGDRKARDVEAQDAADAEALYRTLERQVLPLFFDRDTKGLPKRWLPVMKAAAASSLSAFSTERMLRDYLRDLY